jgi:hypothetical protein
LRLADLPGLASFSARAETNGSTASIVFGFQQDAAFRKQIDNTSFTGTAGETYRVTFTVV